MYQGVPTTEPVSVSAPVSAASPSFAVNFAMPKSRTFTVTPPASSFFRKMLSGFRSRSTIPFAWAASTASTTGKRSEATSRTGTGPRPPPACRRGSRPIRRYSSRGPAGRRRARRRRAPRRHSDGSPRWPARPSRWSMRWRRSMPHRRPKPLRNFMATRRRVMTCVAAHTSPTPPSPRRSSRRRLAP